MNTFMLQTTRMRKNSEDHCRTFAKRDTKRLKFTSRNDRLAQVHFGLLIH